MPKNTKPKVILTSGKCFRGALKECVDNIIDKPRLNVAWTRVPADVIRIGKHLYRVDVFLERVEPD